MNCLHIPQGLAGGDISVLTARPRIIGRSGRFIDATIGAIAHLSAQIPTGVDATSTFDPVEYWPVESNKDAPTLNSEYGPI